MAELPLQTPDVDLVWKLVCAGVLTHPKNCILDGPREMMRLARPSPSTSGGGVVSFWGLTRRQVMRVGAAHVRGGMITRRPWCRLPLMEPPRASTMKLTRNLNNPKRLFLTCVSNE